MKLEQSCWPTPEHELLLRASLLQRREAIEAWREWKSGADVDSLDPGSQRLLPLLYRNLSVLGVEDPLMERFKGFYQRTWVRNQMRFHDMSTVLHPLHSAGIRTVVLKGAALVLLHYRDHGLRPMADFDLLVPPAQAGAAANLLINLDWQPNLRLPEVFTETFLSVRHSQNFEDASGRELDLHWHLLLECCYPGADDDYWAGAVPISINGVPTSALNPTDQLLHVCIHGAKWNPTPPFRWVADAMMVLRTSHSELDWDRLIRQAERHRLILPLRSALSYLRDVLQAPIPPEALAEMQSAPVSRAEHAAYRFSTHRPGLFGGLPSVWFLYLRALRGTSGGKVRSAFLWLPTFFQHVWGVTHLWQMPFYLVYKGARRVWMTVSAYRQ
jgi:hypothetical protein